MTEDFALVDFALTARSPAEVAEAIGRMRTPASRPDDGAARAFTGHGLLSRFFGRSVETAARAGETGGLLLQPTGTLPPPPLARRVLADLGFSAGQSPVRLTGPIGVAGLTLIEFREVDGGTSPFSEALSAELHGDELFYFRHSGSRHPGSHFAFHVYQDGRATRRAVSESREGTMAEADWTGVDSGILHPLETDSLASPGAAKSEIMTPVRQAAILEALGVAPEDLFAPLEDPAVVVLELSADPGGLPLNEARAMGHPRRRATAPGAAKPPPAATAPVVPPTQQPAPEPPSAAPEKPLPGSRPPWEEQTPAPSWEEEVTGILLAAVEAALPPPEQVAWLDRLTVQLEDGEIDGALEEARQIILAGDRSDAEKAAAASRLAALFGRDG